MFAATPSPTASPGTLRREVFFVRGTVEFRIAYNAPKKNEPGVAALVTMGHKLLKRA